MAEEKKEELKVKEVLKVVAEVPAQADEMSLKRESALEKWIPKTSLGKKVFSGEITSIDEIIQSGKKITEAEIVDKLVPALKNEIILIGGRAGKGGGVQRIPVKITAKMHRSGRRFSMGSFAVIGDGNGLIGVGRGSAVEARDAIAKAIHKAKLNVMRIKRGCGSWECGCEIAHSIPFKTVGKSGSVRVELIPGPRGLGLVADSESKKILRLAGISDVWVRTFGNTSARINLISATFDALRKIYIYEKKLGE